MKKIFLIFIISFLAIGLKAQTNLDSLYTIWQDEALSDSIRAKAYARYIWKGFVQSKPDSAFKLAEELLQFGLNKNNLKTQALAYRYQGVSWYNRADYSKAIDYYFQSLKLEQELGDQNGIANCFINLGLIYESQGDYNKALDYNNSSLIIYKEISYISGVANAYNNIGNVYFRQGNYNLALDFYIKSLNNRMQIEDQVGIATSLNNIGLIHEEKGDYSKSLYFYKRSLKIGESTDDDLGVIYYLNNIGNIYYLQGNYSQAIEYSTMAYERAFEIDALHAQQVAYTQLYQVYKAMGNEKKALKYHEKMGVVKDSLFNNENTKKLTQLAMLYEFNKKEVAAKLEQEIKDSFAKEELKRQKLVRNGFIGGFGVVLLFAGVFLIQRNRIGKEKERSEELLLNILPAEVANELKSKGRSDAQLLDPVTVFFTDFKGFTVMSEKLSAKEIVHDLHECFSVFDKICEKHGIEKIKTIGDSYMGACGLPSPNKNQSQNVIKAAFEMRDFVTKGKEKKIAEGRPFFEIRIGIHTGPVVAGIVGIKKYSYDIWGDTVNTASRMESSGSVGKVNISKVTYELLKKDPDLVFESRGKIEAKGKGEMEMYFVNKKIPA